MTVLGRLIGDPADGEPIPTHEFFGVIGEYVEGALTRQQASQVLQAAPFGMTTSEIQHVADWFDAHVDPLNANGKRIALNVVHQVLILARGGVLGYDRARVRARLNWQHD